MEGQNEIRRALEQNEEVLGVSSATFSPAVIETLGTIGMDYVWLDFEHGGASPYDSNVLNNLTRAADASDTELLVRIPSPDPHLIRKVLDAGVKNILVSRIETANEVEQAVEAANFVYDGRPGERGIGIGRTTTWGDSIDEEYVREQDESVLLGVMIEKNPAIDNIDEILAVSDLGFVFIGPADLSVSLGYPMDTSNTEVQDTIEYVEKKTLDSQVPLGGIRNDPAEAEEAIKNGYQVLRIGSDIGAIRDCLSNRLDNTIS